ncbi:MAG: hypothetical protein HY900_17290 [Deltaproteobacteria bacterium]|nr:hypothetical protein [Deltaproteobacteria bacterium]
MRSTSRITAKDEPVWLHPAFVTTCRSVLRRVAPCLAFVLLGPGVRGATVEDVASGTPIVTVQINRGDVFDLDDPSTSAWPYHWVNALHVVTREDFIRRLLLFKAGDPLDPLKLAESEIILRGTGFLNPVSVSARPVPGGAEVTVETHDQWTLAVNISFGVEGDRRSATFGISDDNVFGFGKSFLFDVTDDPERTSTTLRYRDITFLRSRWQLELEHRESSDGSANHFRFEYPFFSLRTPRAAGGNWRREVSTKYLWADGERRVAGESNTRGWEVWGGLRLPAGKLRTNRLLAGAFGESALFRNWGSLNGPPYPQPKDRELLGPEVGWEHQTFRWKVVKGFRAWFRQEDLSLGPNWRVLTGLSLPFFGGDGVRLRYDAAFDSGQLSGRVFTWQRVALSGRVENRGLANAISRVELGGAITGTAGLRVRVAADLGYALDGERQLTLGADTGLRGYDPNTFDGTSRVVANVEWRRRLTGEVLHVAALGVTAFADCGKTWGERVGPSTEGWRTDVGAGLLVELTRTSRVRVVRFEMAFPDRGGGPVYLITTESLF